MSETPLQPQPEVAAERQAALRQQLIRNFNSAPLHREVRAPLYDSLCARLAPGTAARQLGASIDTVAPGRRACPYHFHHAEEEMFIVLQGQGHLRVAGELLALQAGDVVFIPAGPLYPHQIINTSQAPLKYLSVSTCADVEICEYPDSGKYAAFSGSGESALRALHRADSRLDYWDGEP
jgi:uncharacterized cupin superfamily protein